MRIAAGELSASREHKQRTAEAPKADAFSQEAAVQGQQVEQMSVDGWHI